MKNKSNYRATFNFNIQKKNPTRTRQTKQRTNTFKKYPCHCIFKITFLELIYIVFKKTEDKDLEILTMI